MNKSFAPIPMGARSIPRCCKNTHCGRTFYTTQERCKRGRGHFCSRRCAVEPLINFRRGIASGASPEIRKRAVYVAGMAVRKGLLQPKPCEHCGSNQKVEKHHESYDESSFTRVKFLCKKCHDLLHFTVIPQTLEIKNRFFKV